MGPGAVLTEPQKRDRLRLSWALLLLGACVLVYANGLTGAFTYDDKAIVRDNYRLRSPGPEDEAIAREEFDRLLAVLPDDYQHVLALRMEGYTNAEIAARIGRVERTVELKLRAIRGLLGPHLGLPDPGTPARAREP